MTKKSKFYDFSKGDNDFNLSSSNKLLKITKLHNVRGILEDNIFEPTILLETIISELEILESRIDLLENIVEAALGVAIEKN